MDHIETVVVRGGEGRLVLHCGDTDSALLLDGEPVLLAWRDATDPDHRYFVRAYDLAALDDELGDLDVHADGSLAHLLRPILALLPDGAYTLERADTPDVEPAHLAPGERPRVQGRLVDWAGLHRVQSEDVVLLGTVPRDLVGDARVETLTRAIRAGRRPPVVALSTEDGDAAFVIAGHAALEAWRRLGLPPLLVRIDALDPPRLEATEAARLVDRACARVAALVSAHYRAVREAPLPRAALAD